MKKIACSRLSASLAVLLAVCGMLGGCTKKITPPAPMDAQTVSFTPTVYYANDGAITFLYDEDKDMLSTYEGYDMLALYDTGVYTLVISYTVGTEEDPQESIAAEFDGTATVSGKTKKETVSGFSFRTAELSADDGSAGYVTYGNTETGFAKLYAVFSADATEEDKNHVAEIVSSVRFAEFSDTADDYTNVYVQDGIIG